MSKEFDKSLYNENYYQTSFGGIPYNRDSYDGHWVKFFANIAKQIKEQYKPNRTLDVGCAKGFIVESLRDLEVNAFGFDVSDTAISEVRDDIKPYCIVGSIEDPAMYVGQFDLITCIEVLEHVPANMAERAIELISKHTTQVIFSSSPSDFDEPTHINVQPPTYWDELFAKYGFSKAHETWPSQQIAPHTVMYRKHSLQLMENVSMRLNNQLIELDNELSRELKNLSNQIISLTNQNSNVSEKVDVANRVIMEQIKKINEDKLRLNAILDENITLKDQINQLIIKNENSTDEIVELNNRLNELNTKELSLLHNLTSLHVQIAQLTEQLTKIRSGKAFKLLKKYWTVRDNILPLHSRRREFVKSIVKRRKFSSSILLKPTQSIESSSLDTNLWNEGYKRWLEKSQDLTFEVLSKQREESDSFMYKPLISILLPVYKIPFNIFKETVKSVTDQSYENWELCIALADLDNLEVVAFLKEISLLDNRIKVNYLESNGGISKNSNECLNLGNGEFVALLDHDDLITPDALYQMVMQINMLPEADFLYSDKDQINAEGTIRLNPLFKHKWSWATMLSANYPTHFCLIRKSLFDQIGPFDPITDGAQDWDIFLKVSEKARSIVHVPFVLYHWRIIETSVASGLQAKPYVVEAQNKALSSYIKRRSLKGVLERNEDHTFRMVWNSKKDISYDLLIYTDINTQLTDLISTLESIKSQINSPSKVSILLTKEMDGYLNNYITYFDVVLESSSLSNSSVFQANLNNPLLVIKAGVSFSDKELISELASWVQDGNYAAASGKIMDSNHLIVNAGYVFNKQNEIIEPFKQMTANAYTTYGSINWYRDYNAVSELAIMIDKNLFKNAFESIATNSQELTIEQLLLQAQLVITRDQTKAILYNPYSVFHIAKAPHPKELNRGENIIDLHFNPNVWDWNPTYMQANIIPKSVQNNKKVDHSVWSGYTSDALALSTIYDFTSKDLIDNKEQINRFQNIKISTKSATWFLPPFSSAFYGGIHTILRFAEFLSLNCGTVNRFVIVGTDDILNAKNSIAAAFPGLEECAVLGLTSDLKINSIPESDISFCTLWTTAYSLLKYNKTKKKYYFLQDWEPLFYPAGSTSAQVEASLRFGFTAICNTISLKQSYEEMGGKGFHFSPAVDTTVFFPPKVDRQEEPYLVFLYGRPGTPRNGFELALPALRKVKEHFGNKVRIVSAGAEWDAAAYGAEGVIEHLGMLPYKATGDLYRQCHVGLAMMMTRHPSYLPFELMACGCLVVANKNPWNEWMLKDGVNCRVAEASISCIAETIIEALENNNERKMLSNQAVSYIINERSDWDREFNSIINTIF